MKIEPNSSLLEQSLNSSIDSFKEPQEEECLSEAEYLMKKSKSGNGIELQKEEHKKNQQQKDPTRNSSVD